MALQVAQYWDHEVVELNTPNDVLALIAELDPAYVEDDWELPRISSLVVNLSFIPTPFAASLNDRLLICSSRHTIRDLGFSDAERFFRSDPQLADGFAQLRNLKSLDIANIGPEAIRMLRNMRSYLLSAQLFLGSKQTSDLDDPLDNPISLLYRSQATLQTLAVHGSTRNLPILVTYPRLHTLVLDHPDPPRTIDYIAAFPNLRHLNITGVVYQSADDDMWSQMEARRWANIADQEEHGQKWPIIDTVSGDVYNVYALGLRTSVRRLQLTGRSEACWGDCFNAVLDDVSPEELQVTTTCKAVLYASDFLETVCADRDWPLMMLSIVIEVQSGELTEDFDCTLDVIIGALGSLEIEEFELCIDCNGLSVKPISDHPTAIASHSDVEKYLHDLDLDSLAEEFGSSCGRVENVRVSLNGHPIREDLCVNRDMTPDSDDDCDEVPDHPHGSIQGTLQSLRLLTGKTKPAVFDGNCFHPYPMNPPFDPRDVGIQN